MPTETLFELRGITYRGGDFVLFNSLEALPYIGMLLDLSETPGEVMVQWMYRQEDVDVEDLRKEETRLQTRLLNSNKEIFFSTQVEPSEVNSVLKKVSVVFAVGDVRANDVSLQDDLFLIRFCVDLSTPSFSISFISDVQESGTRAQLESLVQDFPYNAGPRKMIEEATPMSHSAMPATIEHTASQRSSVGLPAAAAAVQEEHLETSPQPQLTMLQSLGSIPGVSAAATVHAGRTSEDSEENVDVGDGQEEDVKQIGGGGEVGRIIAAEHTDQMDNKTEEVGLRKEEEMELNAKSAGERSDSMPEIGLVDHVFRAGDKVLAIRNQVARNALAPTDNLNEHVSEGGVGTVPVSEFLKWKTTGSEHIGTLIGKRFMGKMYLGQVVAWNTGEDSGLQKYKVIFHDNDVHAIELPDVISCKDNVTPRLQSAKNLHALCGYVSRWQAVYGRLVKQKQKSSEGAEAGAKEESQWFPATVKAVKGDGFFFVSWQDGYALDRTKCTFELRHLPSKLKDLCEGSKQIPDDTELKEAVNVRSEMPEIGLTKDMNDEPEYAIGTCVRMLFDDGVWYRGWVKKFHHRSNKYTVEFEDGDQQQTHLPGEDVEPLDAKMKEAARLHNMVEPQIGQMLFLYWSGMGRYTGSVSKRHNQGKFLATFCDGDKVLLTRTEVVFGSKIFHDVFMRGNDTVPCACGRAQCRTYFDDQGNFNEDMEVDKSMNKQMPQELESSMKLHGKQREQGEEETARNETKGQKRECGEGAAEAALNELCCCKSGKLFRDCHFLQIQKRESGDRANGSKDDQEGRANKKIRGPTVRGDKTQARDVKRASEGDGTVLEASQEEAGAVQKLGLKCGDFDQPRSKTQEMEAVQDEKRSETKTCNEAGAYGPEVLQGKVDIYWSLEKRWFRGIIDKFNPKTGKHHVRYDDGDKRWYDLQTLGKELRWVKDKPEKQEKVRKEKRKRRVPEKNVCYEEGDGEIYEKSDGDCSLRAAAAILIQADSNDDRLVKNDKYKHRRRIKVVSDSDNDSDYEHSRSSKARHGTFLGNKGDEENGSDEGKFSTGAAAHDGDKDVEYMESDQENDDIENYFLDGPAAKIKEAAMPLLCSGPICDRIVAIQTKVNNDILPKIYLFAPEAWHERRHPNTFSTQGVDSPFLQSWEKEADKDGDRMLAGSSEYFERFHKQEAFLMPYRGYGSYNSHGRFYTKLHVFANVCQYLKKNCLMSGADHFIDFSSGSNEFAPMLSRQVECSFQAFDIFPAKVRTNFRMKDWMTVARTDLSHEGRSKASRLVLGLNPPYGRGNNTARIFVQHGIKIFQPRLIVLIVPELGAMRELQDYTVIHREPCHGKDFYIPGSQTMGAMHETKTRPNFIIYRRRSDISDARDRSAASLPLDDSYDRCSGAPGRELSRYGGEGSNLMTGKGYEGSRYHASDHTGNPEYSFWNHEREAPRDPRVRR